MIFVLDRQERVINLLKNNGSNSSSHPFFDDLLTEDLTTGAETFTFNTISQNDLTRDLVVGNYVAFRKDNDFKQFQITQIEVIHNETMEISVYSESAALSLTNNVFRNRKLTSVTVEKFLQEVLENTDFSVGHIDETLQDVHDFDISSDSCYAVLQNNIGNFKGELQFRVEINNGRVSRKFVDVLSKRGRNAGKRFTFGKNIESVVKTVDSTSLFTALVGVGKNGVTFKDVEVNGIEKPLGQDFVADEEAFALYNHNGNHLMGLLNVDSDSPQEILRKTHEYLQKVKQPKVTYEIPVVLLDNDVKIGDYINILDTEFNPHLRLMARVIKLETSFTNSQINRCTLSNFIEVKSNITDEMRKLAEQLYGYEIDMGGIVERVEIVEDNTTPEAITGVIGPTIDKGGKVETAVIKWYNKGLEVSHTSASTKTLMANDGFYIKDVNDETIASLASADSWSTLKADKVIANNIETIYDGDANLYVNHRFSGETLGTSSNPFNSFSQLASHLQSKPIINKTVNINIVTTGAEITESLNLYGLKGNGAINITYDKSCIQRTGVNGGWCIAMGNIYNPIVIRGGRSSYNSDDGAILCDHGDSHGMTFTDCRSVNVGYLNIDCKHWGIKAVRSNVRGEKIDFCKTWCAYDISQHSICSDSDGVGNCGDFFRVYTGSIFTYGDNGGGYRPIGNRFEYSGKYFLVGAERTATNSFRTPPAVPPTSNYERSFTKTSFATYQYKWSNWSTGECKQGVWDIYGNKAGHIFFDVSAIRSFIGSGTVIDGSTITIKRRNAGGYSSATNIYLNSSTCSSASGTPSYSNNTHIGSLAWNATGTFTLPKSIVNAIKSGSANSLALYSSSNSSAYFEAVECSINIKVNK